MHRIGLKVVVVTALLAAAAIAGCQIGADDEAQQEIAELQGQVDDLRDEVQDLREQLAELESAPLVTDEGEVKMVVYFGLSTQTEILSVPVLRPTDRREDPHRAALELLIAGPRPDSPLSPVMPPETEILSLEVEDGLATVDFSSEVGQHAVGSAGETLVLAGIINTLTEFADIDRVMILVQGEEGVSLGGHYALDEPLQRFQNLIP